jgi:hypothetical protein
MEAGFSFRKHAWTKARKQLIPTLPIEILRGRVKRAEALGLPYKTYASVRASTGRDVVGFLFSNNALRVIVKYEKIAADRAKKLTQIEAISCGLASKPINLDHVDLAAWGVAPDLTSTWSDIRAKVQAPLVETKLPLDGVLVIGDTALEREWSDAGRLAGVLHSDRFFG